MAFAFGFGFNKQKVLSAAEKFVQQGKLQNAIAEYEKIRKHDDKDLTVTNTIGDLYARLGDHAKAVECFKLVGDAYATQGFTVKGIAMYKKISKLAPSVDGSLKLAELYTQQGLFNDARAQYVQVAEDFLKTGEFDQAIRLFQKVLEMDPENVPMRVKLAEVYLKRGKKKEAWEIFSTAAESLRARGSLAAAEDVLQRMLTLDPGNSYVLLMRGRAALENGDFKGAMEHLEKASDLDSHPDGLRDLLKACLQAGDLAKSAPIAEKLVSVHNDPGGLLLLAEGAARLGHHDQALEIYARHADRLLAADSNKFLGNLHATITHVREDAAALAKLIGLIERSGETTHLNEARELLAQALVKNGDLEKARDLYQTLATSEPQNRMHRQNYQQLSERIAGSAPGGPAPITSQEGMLMVEELEATAPQIDQEYPDAQAIAIRSAVTEADLFISYNLPEKALAPLLAVSPQAPNDVRLNQRLASLHIRLQRFNEAAVCCRSLQGAYREAGHPEEALRYGELASRCEEHAQTPPSGLAEPQANMPDASGETKAEIQARPEFSLPEMVVHATSEAAHLSSDSVPELSAPEPAASSAGNQKGSTAASDDEIAEMIEELQFYLQHLMKEQARSVFEKLEARTHDAAILDPLRAAMQSSETQEAEPEVEIDEIDCSSRETFKVEPESLATEPPESPIPAPPVCEPAETTPAPAASDELTALIADLEASIGDSFPVATAEVADASVAAQSGSEEISPLQASHSDRVSGPGAVSSERFAQMLSQPIPHVEEAPHPVAETETPVPLAKAAAASAGMPGMENHGADRAAHTSADIDLSQMFSELKSELEDGGVSVTDDPETHYNMGAAFREMGLLDEAIAEFQKVCSAIDHGSPFPRTIQTYTWLGQCFLDKGVPEAAVRWYEKALDIPGLDSEARLAIHYELGAACERAQDKSSALRHFTYVYGANIDYRDVAERLQALKL